MIPFRLTYYVNNTGSVLLNESVLMSCGSKDGSLNCQVICLIRLLILLKRNTSGVWND